MGICHYKLCTLKTKKGQIDGSLRNEPLTAKGVVIDILKQGNKDFAEKKWKKLSMK